MDTLGIDLGTTNTVVAVDDQVIRLEAGRYMPSVVAYLPNGRVETGSSARSRRSIDSPNTIYSSKRIIGRAWDDVETQEFRDRYPFEMVEVEGRPAFVTRAGTFEPSDIAAVLLSTIFDDLKRIVSGLDLVSPCRRPSGAGSARRRSRRPGRPTSGTPG